MQQAVNNRLLGSDGLALAKDGTSIQDDRIDIIEKRLDFFESRLQAVAADAIRKQEQRHRRTITIVSVIGIVAAIIMWLVPSPFQMTIQFA